MAGNNISAADWDAIVDTLIAEAGGQGEESMRRVGETMINRSALRGLSFGDIVRQPHQYTGFSAPGPAAVQAQRDQEMRAAAERAFRTALQPGDPTGGADHYYNPSIVNPGWQKSMQHTGDYGGHTYYRSRPIPAQALAELLAPVAPTPFMPPARTKVPTDLHARTMATASAAQSKRRIEEMFGPAISASTPRLTNRGGVANASAISTDWANNIFPNTRRRPTPIIADEHLGQGGAVDRHNRALTQVGSLQDALRRSINSQGTTVATLPATPARSVPMPMGTRQSYAAQERAPAARPVHPMPMGTRQSYAAQERAPARVLASSGVGKPPATRVVQSVPAPAAPATRGIQQMAALYANGGPTRPTAAPPKIDTIGVMPSAASLANVFGPQRYNAAAHGFAVGKNPDRLPATPGPRIAAAAPGPALFGGLDPKLAGPAPTPRAPQLAQTARAPKAPAKVPVIEPAKPPVRVAQAAPVSPKVPTRRPDTIQRTAITAPTPRMRPATAIAQPTMMNAYQPAAPRTASPAVAAIASAFNRPAPAPARATVYVRGSNTIQPPPQQQSLWHSDPVGFGNWATSQSGDTSVGNQAEAAAARSSGSGSGGRRR